MVQTFKSIKKEPWEVDEIEHLVKTMGYVKMFNVGVLSQDDIIGVQSFLNGCYLGKTVLLQPISVHYDKFGFPFYRLKRYKRPTKVLSAYERHKIYGPSWNGY